jgi:hypothetical protein
VVQRILVRFSGAGSDVEALTWAQQNIWNQMNETGSPMMVGGTMPLAPGTTRQGLIHLLAFIMSRHESLRTRIRVDPDGTPMQVLSESGEVGFEILELEEGDPAEYAETVRQRYLDEPFDAEKDWPVRMGVIEQNGEPVHFVAMYAHIAIDGYGFEALIRDLDNLDRETGTHLGPRVGMQPREIARHQQSPAGRRLSENSLRYWENHQLAMVAHRFKAPAVVGEPQYSDATFDSPAAYLALRILAARTQLHSGPILLAAYAIALARVSGNSTSVIRTLISNRFRPGFAESVAIVMQPGLCVIDVADCTIDEAAQRTWHSQIMAGKHGYYHFGDFDALQQRVKEIRGTDVQLTCYFNDGRRAFAQMPEGPLPAPQDLLDALGLSTLKSGAPVRIPEMTCFLTVNLVPETINYSLRVDTQYVSIAEQESMLRMIEDVLVSAALDPQSRTNVARQGG